MKKEYINPEMVVVKIATVQHILGASQISGKTSNTGDLLAPGMDWDDDDEDEY